MENKQQLVDSINCKFPHNNIIELYYEIGRALPFTCQRFPDGRVSDWYRNQYVEVVKVEPQGKFGKYGKAYGFYYRGGKREDACENDPEHSWCKKDDKEPQEIPNSGCGSWALIDIIGEPTVEAVKLLSLDDRIGFGKYKEKTLREVIDADWQYVKWAALESQRLHVNVEEIIEYHNSILVKKQPSDIMPFGKYKGKTLQEIADEDMQYLRWLEERDESFVIDWEKLKV